MMKHNAAGRRYLRQIKKEMPRVGKQRGIILSQVKEELNILLTENPDAGYDDIVERFGTPQQITASYLDEMDKRGLAQQLHVRRKIIRIVSAMALVIMVVWIGAVCISIIDSFDDTNGFIVEQVEVIADNGG